MVIDDTEEEEQEAPAGRAYAGQAIATSKLFSPSAMARERKAFEDRARLLQAQEVQDREEVSKYDPADINALTLKTRASKPEPDDPEQEPAYIRNTANFLFGDEMAILGVKWDKEGLTWKTETAIDQWVEHPLLSTVALAGVALPFVGAIKKSAKVGKIAELGYSKFVNPIQKEIDIVKGVKPGFLDRVQNASLLRHGDDWTALADEMLGTIDEDAAVLGGNKLKYFDDKFAETVRQTADPQERLKMLGGRKALQQKLLTEDSLARNRRLALAVEMDVATPMQRLQYSLNRKYANTYFQLGSRVTKAYVQNMNQFWDNAKLDELFKHGLDETDNLPFFKFLNNRLDDADFNRLPLAKQQYFTRTRERYFKHQQDAIASGFMEESTVAKVGLAHTAALYKNTDIGRIADVSTSQRMLEKGGIIKKYPKLYSPTLRERKKTVDEMIESAAKGELIIDVDDVHRTSIVKDEMLHVGYKLIRDVALKAGDYTTNKYALKPEAWDRLSDLSKRSWVSLDDLEGAGVSERIRRMVAKSVGKNPDDVGRLPYVHQNVIDELFDSDKGMFTQMHNANKFLSVLTAIHKPSKTVFNLPSHFQNLASNLLYFMPMAGVNPFKAEVVDDMQKAHKMVWEVAKHIAEKETDAASILNSREALMAIAKKKGVDTIYTTKAGTKIDLIDELSNPQVQRMIEDQAFENVEGFSSVAEMYKLLKADPDSNVFTKGMAKLYVEGVSAVNKLTQKATSRKLLADMSAAYLAEDMVPKLATYMQLRKRGASVESAVLDIGRKFPQYKTVGKSIKQARRFAFPWITFQAETARIMKNNMIDSPLASFAWFQAPGLVQAGASGIGYGPTTPEELQAAKEGSPFWATKASTVFMDPQAQAASAGAVTGATVGGVVGGITAGSMGFKIGAAAGALVTGGAALAGTSEEDGLRAWALDFLPFSSIMPKTDSPYVDPRQQGAAMIPEMLKISPLEPLSVLMPVIRMAFGEDDFGNEIPTEGLSDGMMKIATGTFGILAPPWVQKYGLRIGTPDAGIFGLDRVSSMTLAGTAGAIAGYKYGGTLGAGIGAVAGGGLGSQIDTSRFEEDLGMRVNSKTGERGNPVFDVLFNSTTGLGKSWKATPAQKAFNEKLRDDNVKKFRATLRKRMVDAATNNDEDRLNDLIQDYFITYSQQYDNPGEAQAKFHESMKDLIPKLRRHPQYSRYSEEELQSRFREASAFAIENRGKFMDARVADLQRELMVRAVGQHKSGDAIGYDFNYNFQTGRPSFGKQGIGKRPTFGT